MSPTATSDKILLIHILECLARIREYTDGNRNHFFESRLVQDAVIRNLQTLAESTQRLSDAVKAKRPEIPWRSVAGFRNVLVHGYLGLDVEAVWTVVDNDLGPLEEAVTKMLRALDGEG